MVRFCKSFNGFVKQSVNKVGRNVLMKCPVCGEEYREGDRFCACCGAQLPEPASPEPVSVKQASNIPEPALTTEVDMWGPSQAKKDLENAMSNQPEEGASPFSSPYDGVSP